MKSASPSREEPVCAWVEEIIVIGIVGYEKSKGPTPRRGKTQQQHASLVFVYVAVLLRSSVTGVHLVLLTPLLLICAGSLVRNDQLGV